MLRDVAAKELPANEDAKRLPVDNELVASVRTSKDVSVLRTPTERLDTVKRLAVSPDVLIDDVKRDWAVSVVACS